MSIRDIQELLGSDIILFVGAPLSGKGTQGSQLAKVLERPYISSGDLFRAEIALGTELGLKIKTYMESGELIPNELTTDFLTSKLSESIYQYGMVLDGYPRNLSHLPIIENILKNVDRSIFIAIYLDVSKSDLDQRRAKRGRLDDDGDTFERRYQIFQQETLPLVEYFQKNNKLINVKCDCQESPDDIHQKIISELNALKQKNFNYLSAYEWLEMNLQMENIDKPAVYEQFRRRALEENEKQGRRTGILRRIVYLRTKNIPKYHEHVEIFEKLYGIEVIRVPPIIIINGDYSDATLLLQQKTPGLVQLALITEKSNLYRPGSQLLSSLHHGVRTVNQAKLVALWIDSQTNESIKTEFLHSTVGRIDLQRRKTFDNDPTIFGWDDIFVVEGSGMTYQQLKELGIKHSSRDMVISAFLKQRVHYKTLLNLKSEPQPQVMRAIDFSIDVADYVANHPIYNHSQVIEYGFRNLIDHVLNSGVFFRAAHNRRQANYWSPGLNGGLPLTAKADPIHEATFMAHDFGHFAIPDLVYTGHDSLLHRRAYIGWRMISEATTMTLADMLLVDGLSKSGVEYDFSKRRIYPLFQNLNIDLSEPSTRLVNLKKIIYANYKYCLLGDDSMYAEMLPQGRETPSLIEFKKKFSPFFVEDFRWTERNYENMVARSEEMSRWWNDLERLRQLPHVEHVMSIDNFLDQISKLKPNALHGSTVEFVDAIFDIVFESKVKPVLNLQPPALLEPSQRLYKGFSKWIIAQLAITSKYYFLSESTQLRDNILSYISELADGRMTIENVHHVRSMFEEYLRCLSQKNLISHDDEKTYAELYPLFDPFYVNYDKEAAEYEDLATISTRIFSIEDYREKQLSQMARCVGRPITANERFYTSVLFEMIEAGDGQTAEGIFVTRPGVMLLSTSPVQHRLGMVTFLLSGIAIETSLELVAHHEAKVARLTSSKTNAMNHPLFRIQGSDTLQQRQYLKKLIASRTAFDSIYQPRQAWGSHGNEFFNMIAPACKVTAVCYTMTLADYHKLFIGRMSPTGNEQEMIHVVHRMATQLHKLYPKFIQEPNYYRNCGNAMKYSSIENNIEDVNPISSLVLMGKSKLTDQAVRLMTKLNIANGDDSDRLAEFRSRITYLAYSRYPTTIVDQKSYLQKIIDQHGHWSILDACQVVFRMPEEMLKSMKDTIRDCFMIEQNETDAWLFATMKRIKHTEALLNPNDLRSSVFSSMLELLH